MLRAAPNIDLLTFKNCITKLDDGTVELSCWVGFFLVGRGTVIHNHIYEQNVLESLTGYREKMIKIKGMFQDALDIINTKSKSGFVIRDFLNPPEPDLPLFGGTLTIHGIKDWRSITVELSDCYHKQRAVYTPAQFKSVSTKIIKLLDRVLTDLDVVESKLKE